MQVRGGEYIVDVRPVVPAVRQQGGICAGQGPVRQGGRQQVLPVALVSAAVVRQVDDEVRAAPGGVVEVPDSPGFFLVVRVIVRQEAVHLQVSDSRIRQQEGVKVLPRLASAPGAAALVSQCVQIGLQCFVGFLRGLDQLLPPLPAGGVLRPAPVQHPPEVLRLDDPEVPIGPQAVERAVKGGVEGLVAVVFENHRPVIREDALRRVLRVFPVVDAQAEVAVLQGFHKVVVVLQSLLLGQSQGVFQGRVPFALRLRRGGAGAQKQAEDQGQGNPYAFHKIVSFFLRRRPAASLYGTAPGFPSG